jgi:hypothetical protein
MIWMLINLQVMIINSELAFVIFLGIEYFFISIDVTLN